MEIWGSWGARPLSTPLSPPLLSILLEYFFLNVEQFFYCRNNCSDNRKNVLATKKIVLSYVTV